MLDARPVVLAPGSCTVPAFSRRVCSRRPGYTVKDEQLACIFSADVCVYYCRTYYKAVRGGERRRVEDMCYERRRAEACVDESAHHALANAKVLYPGFFVTFRGLSTWFFFCPPMFRLLRHFSALDGAFCNLAGSSCASRYEEEWVLLTIAAASESGRI